MNACERKIVCIYFRERRRTIERRERIIREIVYLKRLRVWMCERKRVCIYVCERGVG